MKKVFTFIMALLATFTVQGKEIDMSNAKVLVVYFSRTGDQYSVGNITKGNTAIMAEMIADYTGGDLFEIKLKNDTYPTEYTPLTEVAKEEKNTNARPEIAKDVDNFDTYDTIFVGGPVWWSDLPMAIYTFIEKHDWSNKTVIPFTTHEGSGLSSVPRNLKNATKANMLDGLAIFGHVAQNEQDEARMKVNTWLEKIGFKKGK